MGRQLSFYLILSVCSLLAVTGWAKDVPTGLFIQSQCLECHEKEHPETVAAWQTSTHAMTAPIVDCVACHGDRHDGAIVRSRKNDVCIACHGGPDGAVVKSYRYSKHSVITTLEKRRWNWDLPLSDGNYRAPTCAYCHLHDSDHAMGGKKETPYSLQDPRPDMAEAALERRTAPCYDCHSPRFITTWFRSGERMVAVGRMKVREAAGVVEKIKGLEDVEAIRKSKILLKNMVDKHLRNVRLGAFHQSPDHQWWHGQPALDGDLLRIKGVYGRLLRLRNVNPLPVGEVND